MKKAVILVIVILLACAGAAYYFLKPASSPVSAEQQKALAEVCISLSKNFLSGTPNIPSNGCKELGLTRFACEAALRNDQAYASSSRLEKDCEDIALQEAVIESGDKRNCEKLPNTVLKEECLTMLS